MTRIYTEDKNRAGIVAILDALFDGYTVIPTLGRWHGKDERSLCIELLDSDREKATQAAIRIKELNRQESVLVTEEPVASVFV